MSLKSLFSGVVANLTQKEWSPEVQEFAEALVAALSSADGITLDEPLVLNNKTNGSAIRINNVGSTNHSGLSVINDNGEQSTLGVGMGSEGIVANELVPLVNYSLDPDLVHQKYSSSGKHGGDTTLTPDSTENPSGSPSGPGVKKNTQGGADLKSGYNTGNSGTGIPGLVGVDPPTFVAIAGYGKMLASLQKSSRVNCSDSSTLQGSHPPDTSHQLTLNGNPVWWIKNLHGWAVNRGEVTAVHDEYLEVKREIIGDTVTVAKPPALRTSGYDDETINGITYAVVEGDSQSRTASSGGVSESQSVDPAYDAETAYVDGSEIYIRWVSNGTGVTDTGGSPVCYIDINVDAREWVAS